MCHFSYVHRQARASRFPVEYFRYVSVKVRDTNAIVPTNKPSTSCSTALRPYADASVATITVSTGLNIRSTLLDARNSFTFVNLC